MPETAFIRLGMTEAGLVRITLHAQDHQVVGQFALTLEGADVLAREIITKLAAIGFYGRPADGRAH